MTISYGMIHLGSSTESVTVQVAEKTTMVSKSIGSVDPKTGRVTTTYSLASDDPNHPGYVVVSCDPVSPKGSRYGSVTLKTWVTATDSVTGAITYWPFQASTSFVVDNTSPVQTADFMKALACTFSYTYASVSSGTRDTAWGTSLLFGNPTIK